MKKQIITLAIGLFFFTQQATAQFDIGLGFTGTTKVNQVGFQLKGNFLPKSAFRTSADLTFFTGNSKMVNNVNTQTNYWAINANEHFVIPVNDQITAYPLAGFNLLFNKAKAEGRTIKNNSFGINLGAGMEYTLMDRVVAFGEFAYVMSDTDRMNFTAGIAFKFGN